MASDYKQYNYGGYTYSHGSFAAQACGPCAVADVVKVSPLTVAQWLTNNGFSTYQQGTSWGGIAPALTAFGAGGKTLFIGWNSTEAKLEEFRKSIQSGYEGVLCMGARAGTYWTTGGHYICVCGYKDGQYLVHDPASVARTGWHPWSRFEGNVKCAYTSISKWGEGNVDTYSFKVRDLKQGSNGKDVTLLQRLLCSRGMYPAKEIDGSFGPKTDKAVRTYQKWISEHGGSLVVDGICGPATWESILGLSGNVKTVHQVQFGSKNISVYIAQELLISFGLYHSALDGEFGLATRQAVIDVQKKCNIAQDGVCGPITFRKMIDL